MLKDTLVGYELPAWQRSVHRKPLSTSKFYLFDPGVVRKLQGRTTLGRATTEFGTAFEHYIFHELCTYRDYKQPEAGLCYWKSKSGFEVDFIFADRVAIEVKSRQRIGDRDLKNLYALREERKLKHFVIVCMEKNPRILNGIHILPWQRFLADLWNGGLDVDFG